ncbi:MAG: hypothetical protein K9G38_07800 [Bacteroidales bacterium]|nr:hypothetical protein [Bacteroidales bacterium]
MRRILLFICVLFMGFLSLMAQNTCTEQLTQAQRSFDDGLLDDIPLMLENCMEDGFTKEEKTNAYKLLIQTYLFNEAPQKADEVMMQFLNEFPSYSIAVNDPKEFINLYSTYRTDPIFKIEVRAGTVFTTPIVTQYFGPSDVTTINPDYQVRPGFNVEANFINTLIGDFDYSAGISFTVLRLEYLDLPYDYSTVEATLNHFYLGIPLAIRYNYDIGPLTLYATSGIEPVYLLSSTGSITRTDDIIGEEPIPGTEIFTDAHRMMDVRPFLSLGTNIDLGRDQLKVTIGYKFTIFNQLNPAAYYSDINHGSKYFYFEDDMLLHHGHVSLSYIRPIYQPKKIR